MNKLHETAKFSWAKLSNPKKITILTLAGLVGGTLREKIPEFEIDQSKVEADIKNQIPKTVVNERSKFRDLLFLCRHEAWKCENDRSWKKIYKSQVQSSLMGYAWAITLLTAAGEITTYVSLLGLSPFPLLLLFAQFRLDQLRFNDESVRWKEFEMKILNTLEKGDLSTKTFKELEAKKLENLGAMNLKYKEKVEDVNEKSTGIVTQFLKGVF